MKPDVCGEAWALANAQGATDVPPLLLYSGTFSNTTYYQIYALPTRQSWFCPISCPIPMPSAAFFPHLGAQHAFPVQPTHQLLCSSLDLPWSSFKDAGIHEIWYLITVTYSRRALVTCSHLALTSLEKRVAVCRTLPLCGRARTHRSPGCLRRSPLCYMVIEGRANYIKQYVLPWPVRLSG